MVLGIHILFHSPDNLNQKMDNLLTANLPEPYLSFQV